MGRKEPNKVPKRSAGRISKNKKDIRDMVEIIRPALQEMITDSDWVVGPYNKGTILFTTRSLKKAIPNKGDIQWSGNAIFVFEIKGLKTLCLTTKVFPGDKKTRDKVLNALSGLDSINNPGDEDVFVIHIWYKTSFTASDFIGKEKDKIKEMLKEDWDKISGEVKKVEKGLLKHFKINNSQLSEDSNKIRTYLKIIDFIRKNNESGFYPKVADMVEHLAKLDKNAPRQRTVQRYILELRTDFHIYIDQKGKRGGYEIMMNEMNATNNYNEVYESFRILENAGYFNDLFEKSKTALQYICFDGKQFTGYHHIETILAAIVQSRMIKIMHKKFDGEENERKVKPYLLKEYHNRWYLVGYGFASKEMRTFGLDRIDKITITDETFDNTKTAQVKDSFKDVIGITNPDKDKLGEVVLKFDKGQINYFRTYPWHESAKIEENEKGEWIVSMYVSVNYELHQLILMNHEYVQVLKPIHLADSVKSLLEDALENYA